MKRPSYKPEKVKYFDKEGNVQYQMESSALTIEDNFSKFDMPWLTTLRDRAHSVQSAHVKKRK
jgi:hypothetical protein